MTQMKPGELRKFKALGFMTLNPYVSSERVADQTFMVISLYPPNWNPEDSTAYVDFIIGDRFERGWGRRWVERNSVELQ
jgi:hypothetical protein